MIGTLDAVEESNHRCDGPYLQFMTHLQHVLIESEATPMRLMPCVPPTQTGLPLPSTMLQVFTAHGNAVAAAASSDDSVVAHSTALSCISVIHGVLHRSRRLSRSLRSTWWSAAH